MADNMRFYGAARAVPKEAQREIASGRLKGKTDINPMWRIKKLTELYGPCGVGWWYDITKKEIVNDEVTKQAAAFVDILLYYKDPETGEVSHGIPGTGGASFVAQESKGPYLSDECFKMALTDALSVAAKALGVAADVYFAKDATKYSDGEPPAYERSVPDKVYFCKECGKPITDGTRRGGAVWPAADIAAYTERKYGRCLCVNCGKAAQKVMDDYANREDGEA